MHLLSMSLFFDRHDDGWTLPAYIYLLVVVIAVRCLLLLNSPLWLKFSNRIRPLGRIVQHFRFRWHGKCSVLGPVELVYLASI